jgi:hypothetical protein
MKMLSIKVADLLMILVGKITVSVRYRQQRHKHATSAIANQRAHATVEELLEVVFSMPSEPRLHKESI